MRLEVDRVDRPDQVDQLIKRMASELTTRDARISELERKLRLDAIAELHGGDEAVAAGAVPLLRAFARPRTEGRQRSPSRRGEADGVTIDQRLSHLRQLLSSRGRFSFDEAVADADRVTEAMTLFALLELYKAGEAEWEQLEPFGPITVRGSAS